MSVKPDKRDERIARLRNTLKAIEVYAASKDDAKGMAAKALLADDEAGK